MVKRETREKKYAVPRIRKRILRYKRPSQFSVPAANGDGASTCFLHIARPTTIIRGVHTMGVAKAKTTDAKTNV